MSAFSFTYNQPDKKIRARVGEITTPHGVIHTPAFVPVGTQASVKSLSPDELTSLGVQLFFVNTYHTYLRPGLDVIKKFGGLHAFVGWNGPIITDSGGFQVFSLAKDKFKSSVVASTPGVERELDSSLVKISDEGVEFRSVWDGSKHFFTPERSMQYQWTLGSDIHIAFDECTTYPTTHEYAKAAMERTHRWAVRSLCENEKLQMKSEKVNAPYQAFYGVVQGSIFEDLRIESAKFITGIDTDGIAIGGVSVGESKKEMKHVLEWVVPRVPDDKPRHLLGVGEIDDIFVLVEHGIDTFDCVQPTRLARMGRMLIHTIQIEKHELDITKSIFAKDMSPIDPLCLCYTCTHFSRAYIHHLFHVRELLGYRLATIHNIYFMQHLVSDIRAAISDGSFLELKKQWM
jgi:queuine tRNA-ribosyltransferase